MTSERKKKEKDRLALTPGERRHLIDTVAPLLQKALDAKTGADAVLHLEKAKSHLDIITQRQWFSTL